ncbi:MAG: glycosyltransferase [Pseudomonadota bacterium]
MKLTVATVALNAAADLPLTLESIIAQSHPDIELLVIDGESWDGTPDVLARYADEIDRLETIEDGGIYYAMNAAAHLASGDFTLFMNAGDRFHDATSAARIAERWDGRADIVYGNHVYRTGKAEEFKQAWDMGGAFDALRHGRFDTRWLERFPAHQSTFTRTALLREMPYDTAFRICADHDFFLRAIGERGVPHQFVDEIVSIYEAGGFSQKRVDTLFLEWNALQRRYAADPLAIDSWYFGGNSPFRGTDSAGKGQVVSGLLPPRPADIVRGVKHPHQYMQPEGFRLLTPKDRRAVGLLVVGTNRGPQMQLGVAGPEGPVAEAMVPTGPFVLELGFGAPLPSQSPLTIFPDGMGGMAHLNDEMVAIKSFTFRTDRALRPRAKGQTLHFTKANLAETTELLGSGWYQAEASHTWSQGMISDVRVATADGLSDLVIDMRPNPVVRGQTVSVTINGHERYNGAVAGAVKLSVGDVWYDGGRANTIAFRPSASANVGSDPRDLGIQLVTMKLA